MNKIIVACLFLTVHIIHVPLLFSQDAEVQPDIEKETPEEGEKREEKREKKEMKLDKVVVKGDILSENSSSYTVHSLDSKEIRRIGLSKTADLIKEIPGIEVTDYNQGGISNAFIMRGFQSGVHGGDMGVYLDGIPLNEYYGHGGGYADPNVLIPLELEKILVYKGPSSALYGNFSRGGTIAFYTKKKGDYLDVITKYGSFNTADAQVALGKKIGKYLWNNTAVQFYRTDGYTDHSKHLLGNASTRFTLQPIKELEISLSLRGHGADWEAPGYISRVQWERKGMAFKQAMFELDNSLLYRQIENWPPDVTDIADNDGGERRQFSERLDVGYTVNKYVKILVWGFGLQSQWIRFAKMPGGTQSERWYRIGKYGNGININLDIPIYKKIKIIATIGYDFFRDGTAYRQYGTQNRVRQSLTQKRYTTFDNHAIYMESEIRLHRFFRPMIGLRGDIFTGKFTDRMVTSLYGITISTIPIHVRRTIKPGDLSYFSPKFGFRSTLVEDILDLRASACNGFQLPPDNLIFDPAYRYLEPSKIWQYETGLTATYKKYLWADAAAYLIDQTDEVKEYPTGSQYYKNMGTTRRWGVEAAVKVMPIKWIEVEGKLTWSDSEIRKVPRDNIDNLILLHNTLPNIPDLTASVGLYATTPIGLGAKARWSHVGTQYTDDYNLSYKKYKGYKLLDLGIFYAVTHEQHEIEVGFEVKNVLNEHYATTSLDDFYWSTGAPRAYYGTVRMKW